MRVFENIDWALLRIQKEQLIIEIDEALAEVAISNNSTWVNQCQTKADLLEGVLHLIDHFQDCAVEAGVEEGDIFGDSYERYPLGAPEVPNT